MYRRRAGFIPLSVRFVGDTVNIAARMESVGQAITDGVRSGTETPGAFFPASLCRRKVGQNIGEVKVYLVDRLLPEYSADADGLVPNAAFLTRYVTEFFDGPGKPARSTMPPFFQSLCPLHSPSLRRRTTIPKLLWSHRVGRKFPEKSASFRSMQNAPAVRIPAALFLRFLLSREIHSGNCGGIAVAFLRFCRQRGFSSFLKSRISARCV